MENTLNDLKDAKGYWFDLIEILFLNKKLKDEYAKLVKTRCKKLEI